MYLLTKNIFRMKTSSITTDPSLSLTINPFSSRLTYHRKHYSQLLKFSAIHLMFKEVGKRIYKAWDKNADHVDDHRFPFGTSDEGSKASLEYAYNMNLIPFLYCF